jgi:hypothetical protein
MRRCVVFRQTTLKFNDSSAAYDRSFGNAEEFLHKHKHKFVFVQHKHRKSFGIAPIILDLSGRLLTSICSLILRLSSFFP